MKIRNVLFPILTLAACVSVIFVWTRGFSAFTVYSYTLEEAGPTPRSFPNMELINQDGQKFETDNSQNYTLVNFVYLNCPGVCHKVNNELEQIYHMMDSTLVPSKLQFLTISFDLENDNPEKIKRYRSYFGADISGWTFALPYQTSNTGFQRTLKNIGIWMNQDTKSGVINHSINLFLVSPENKIVKIFDPARENKETIKEELEQCLNEYHVASSL